MTPKKQDETKKRTKKKNKNTNYGPVFCHALGITMIVVTFILTLPLVVPTLFGYEPYEVVTGSMTPTIPAGSVIYVHPVEQPEDIQEDEIIAFYDGGDVIAHRVVENRRGQGEFITKGDANNAEDPDPIAYTSLVGVVTLHIPVAGHAMALYSSNIGKVYLMLTLACGILLNVMGEVLRRRRSKRLRAQLEGQILLGGSYDKNQIKEAQQQLAENPVVHWIRTVVMALLALIFFGTLGVILWVNWQYKLSDETYDAAQQSYTTVNDSPGVKAAIMPPIKIDFAALLKENPDIQGWIYCEGTDINYPVLRGETNDTYLRHDYHGDYNVNGSIFVDSLNSPGFTDANTIIYGHHMATGTMFAVLDYWQTQKYYEEHPYMWLLTPTQDYQVVLVSAHHVSAYSDFYDIYRDHDDLFRHFLDEAIIGSDFVPLPNATVNPDRNYVMLSTCAYIFEGSRYVIHGKLVPVNSAGGVMLKPDALGPAFEANQDRLTPEQIRSTVGKQTKGTANTKSNASPQNNNATSGN